jgi:hypothetical protein
MHQHTVGIFLCPSINEHFLLSSRRLPVSQHRTRDSSDDVVHTLLFWDVKRKFPHSH